MKTLLFLSVAAILFLNACCDKRACDGALTPIIPYGFDTTDMYRMSIERYAFNSGFSKRIDSSSLNASRDNSDGLIKCYYTFQSGIDYKIIFTESETEFQVTSVQLKQGVCDHCTFNMYGETYYDYFERCKVNGTVQYASLRLHNE